MYIIASTIGQSVGAAPVASRGGNGERRGAAPRRLPVISRGQVIIKLNAFCFGATKLIDLLSTINLYIINILCA